jgi:hypothetical protein
MPFFAIAGRKQDLTPSTEVTTGAKQTPSRSGSPLDMLQKTHYRDKTTVRQLPSLPRSDINIISPEEAADKERSTFKA